MPIADRGSRPSDMMRLPLALSSLAVLAVVAGIGWRLEVELHGWAGLGWLDYFHWAVPASVALFIGWVSAVAPIRPGRLRRALVIKLVVAAAILGPLFVLSLRISLAAGSRATVLLAYPSWVVGLLRTSILVVAPVVPITMCSLARRLDAPPSLLRCAGSIALFLGAVPLALPLLEMFGQPGHVDVVHAIKSGFAVPWMVIALGLPFLPVGARQGPLRGRRDPAACLPSG
jgi:hypothetical protein